MSIHILEFFSHKKDYFHIFAKIIRMRRTKLILVVLTCLLLLFSSLQKQFHIVHFRSLKGVEEENLMPKLTFAAYRDGSFQAGTEQYIKQHFGGREPLIRLYNQYVWDFYGKTNATEYQIVMGKEGWFYEPWFVEDYFHGGTYSHKCDSVQLVQQFEDEAFRIYQLQRILESCGTHLFVCLLPGKDLIYPEYLPENKQYKRKKIISARDYFCPKFKELGVNHVNVEQWFLQMKDTANFPLFPRTGTHWSNLASLYVADSVIRYMEQLGDMNISNLKIGVPSVGKTREPDDDLESLMNLARPLDQNYNLYAEVEADGDPTAVKPKIIVIGDSFYWNIARQLPMDSIFCSFPFWYYNSSVYYDTIHSSVEDVNLIDELLSADFVILSYCSLLQYEMSNDFTMNALINICYDSAEMQRNRDAIRMTIEMKDEWREAVAEKADKRGQTIDEVIESETTWMLKHSWRRYYPSLCDSLPRKRSQRFLRTFDDNAYIKAAKKKTEEAWRRTGEIMEMLQKKADERGISVDSMMKLDIQWITDEKIRNGEINLQSCKPFHSNDKNDLN